VAGRVPPVPGSNRAIQHRKRIVFHVPAAFEQACAFRFLRAVREQFGSGAPVFRKVAFADFKVATVERGSGWLSYGGRRTALTPGMIYVLFEGAPVSFGPDPADPMEVTFAVVVGEGFGRVLADVGLTPKTPVVTLGPAPELREIFRALRDRQGAYVPRAHGQLWSLLARIAEAGEAKSALAEASAARDTSGSPAPASEVGCASHDPAVSRALAAVRLHFHEPELRLADLAQAACLGRSQFASRFRRATGCTPGEYLERLRLAEARALLADKDLSVCEVAYRAGFKDPAYFARRFRRTTGQTPSAFRSTARPRVGSATP
jgi:AraC family transcriptional regulator